MGMANVQLGETLTEPPVPTRVVVLGGGFAGVYTARHLSQLV